MKQIIPKEKQKLIYIKWQDAHANGGWFNLEQLQKLVDIDMWIVEEVGWIIYEDEKEIHLVSRRGIWKVDQAAEYGMYQRIPKGWILKRKLVKP